MNYCTKCKKRTDSDKESIDRSTNKPGFCSLGYTQNPIGEEATKNALSNKAELCERAKNQIAGSH